MNVRRMADVLPDLVVSFLREGKTVRFVANGLSMQPVINDGETIVVEPVVKLRRGEIYVYEKGDGIIVHRLIRIDGDRLTFRGERAIDNDPPVARDRVIGRVVTVKRT